MSSTVQATSRQAQLAAEQALDAMTGDSGIGLMRAHMLHGSRSVPPELFSEALALLVDGIAARAGDLPQPTGASR
jgi:hypothetical protein